MRPWSRMKIAETGPLPSLRHLLPHFVAAGKVACKIQDSIIAHGNNNGEKKSGDRFTEVLTDADILVESYLGTVLLSTFEDIAFYGEEYERDRVSGYFPKEARYLVTLDPIDGTLYFKDGLPLFSTIMTVCEGDRIVAAVVYLPREGRFYLAARGEGSWTTTDDDVVAGKALVPHAIAGQGNILLLGTNFLAHKPALEAAGFSVTTPSKDYDGSKDWNKTSVRMLSGEVVAMAFSKAQLIDAGAIAFIAAQAGAADNAPVFDRATMRAEPLIVAQTKALYDKIVGILGA
jgi:myo-inositol-1(or 4)-monophosphatase